MTINDLYRSLFGRSGTQKGTDIDMSEHGRVGGLSTGQAFKYTMQVGSVDPNNSTSNTLGVGGTFTGTATDVLDYAGITVLVDADVTGTLHAEFSPDGTNWYNGESYTIPATTLGNAKFFTPPIQGRYYRLVYTNDGTIQSRFRIHSVLKPNPVKWSSHNLNSNLKDDDDAELNVSVLKLRTAQDNYVSGAATNGGNFKVSLEETNGYEPTQYEGGEVTVGTSAVEVTFTGQTKSILIQADHSNTGNVWIGKSNVTSSANRMARLMAGESVTLTLNDASNPIYAISDTASQKIYKLAITQ